jgi:hypothetical protein
MEIARLDLENMQNTDRPKMITLQTKKSITLRLDAEDDLKSQPDALHKSYITLFNGSSTNITTSSQISTLQDKEHMASLKEALKLENIRLRA